MELDDVKRWLVEVIDEEFSPRPIEMARRWVGGTMVLKPSNDSQPKEIPIEVFFRKVIGIREGLRVLEQKINSHSGLTAEDKLNLEAYITKAQGSLTTLNILFKEDKDKFVGSGTRGGGGQEDNEPSDKMTLGVARKKLGLNEYGGD